MLVDDIDFRIIELLTKDSRTSFRKIAREIGLSTETAKRRYQKLQKEADMQPTITVDYVKLGYEAMAYFNVRVASQGRLPAIIEEVAKIPDVTTIIKAIGAFDLLLIALVRSVKHAFKIGEEIEAISDISRVTLDMFWLPRRGDPTLATFPPIGWHSLRKQTP